MMVKALTVAGSDPAGCAGIQADLKTFAALDVFGMSVITALTSQNTLGVTHIMPATMESVVTQIDAVLSDVGADAVKTGMLFSKEIIAAVADRLEHWNVANLVVDPVMVASTGAVLLDKAAIDEFVSKIFPHAKIITPNIPEAETLLNMKITTKDEAQDACRKLAMMGPRTVLIKGGHAFGEIRGEALDIWYDGKSFHEFSSPWIRTNNLHGTGCTYSAAITAYLAMKNTMENSIGKAKIYISKAIEAGSGRIIGKGQGPVDHFWQRRLPENN